MSEFTTCDWCGEERSCEDEGGEWVCDACACWNCPKCGSVVQISDYRCIECDGCDNCCGCERW